MFDRATGRVVAVIVLLIVIAASLRGYLPGVDRAAQKSPPDSGASLLYVVAMLAIAVGIGFIVSAGASFALSRHLGLIAEPRHG